MQFQPPTGDASPVRPRADISADIDSIFNTYMAMRNQGRMEKSAALAEKDRLAGDVLKYGFDPRQMTPENYQQARIPLAQGPALPGQQSPAQAQSAQEPAIVGLVRAHIQKQQDLELATRMKGQANLANTRADTVYKQAEAWAKLHPKPDASGILRPIPGYRFLPNGNMEAIQGGPASAKILAAQEKANMADMELLDKANSTLGKLDQAARETNSMSAGWGGATIGKLPASSHRTLAADLDTIKSNLAMEEMKKLKALSSTGATGFGQLSEKELAVITDSVSKLDASLDPAVLKRNIQEVKNSFQKVINKVKLSQEKRGSSDVPQADPLGIL